MPPGGLLHVVGEHGCDEFVLAVEAGVERAAGQPCRGGDRRHAGSANSLLGEHCRGRLEKPLASLLARRTYPGS